MLKKAPNDKCQFVSGTPNPQPMAAGGRPVRRCRAGRPAATGRRRAVHAPGGRTGTVSRGSRGSALLPGAEWEGGGFSLRRRWRGACVQCLWEPSPGGTRCHVHGPRALPHECARPGRCRPAAPGQTAASGRVPAQSAPVHADAAPDGGGGVPARQRSGMADRQLGPAKAGAVPAAPERAALPEGPKPVPPYSRPVGASATHQYLASAAVFGSGVQA